MARADVLQPAHPRQNLRWRFTVVVVRPGDRSGCQDSRIEHPADQQRDLPRQALLKQPSGRHLVEQGEAAGKEEAVEISMFQRLEADFDLVRSEEHTSELQSLMRISYAVFSLKNKITT